MTGRGRIEIRIGEIAETKGIRGPSELARVVGVSRQSARNLLNARTSDDLARIEILTLEKLCHGLKTSPGRLLVYDPPRRWSSSGAHDDPRQSDDPAGPAVVGPPG